MRKPREKATPIIAMPLPLVEGVETSVTIAVDKETFPAGEVNIYLMLCLLLTFWDSTQDSSHDKYCEVGGEHPKQVRECDTWKNSEFTVEVTIE